MSELTCGASEMKTDLEAAEDLVKSIDPYFWAEDFREHREAAYLEERAKIVAWLMKEENDYRSTKYAEFVEIIRMEIEAGEHLK
jgi:hypothetical protein